MLTIALVLAIFIVIAITIRILAIYSTKLMKVFIYVKTKMQYNSLLRYAL